MARGEAYRGDDDQLGGLLLLSLGLSEEGLALPPPQISQQRVRDYSHCISSGPSCLGNGGMDKRLGSIVTLKISSHFPWTDRDRNPLVLALSMSDQVDRLALGLHACVGVSRRRRDRGSIAFDHMVRCERGARYCSAIAERSRKSLMGSFGL